MAQHLDDRFREFGEAAERLTQIGALEGAAGNISLFLPADTPDLAEYMVSVFSETQDIELPGRELLPLGTLIITGSGRRLRDVVTRPVTILCAIVIANDRRATLHRSPESGVTPTSENDSHIAIHAAALDGQPAIHSVVHAQPPALTWLSHIPAYRNVERLNRQLFRWQPETLVTFPEGLGVLPFEVPGTATHGNLTAQAMRHHRIVVWAKHGVVARSSAGPMAAADLIDYAEAAAEYEVRDMLAGRPADGLTLAELRAIAARYAVPTVLLDRLPDDLLER